MVYTTNIPQATDLISNSQAQILGNFQFLGSTAGNAATGYYYMPNGLLMQWGVSAALGVGNQVINFPVAFTTPYIVTLGTSNDSSGTKWISLNQTRGGGAIHTTDFGVRVSTAGQDLYWFAIGLA